MILFDTSVWIDFLVGGTHWTRHRLRGFIEDNETVAY